MKKSEINFSDFQKLDIRVGTVKSADYVPGSKKLIALSVDLGADYGLVEILAGMGSFYVPSDFVGKKFLFVANLEPKEMLGRTSNGMMFVPETEGKPLLVPLPSDIPNGTFYC